MNVRLTIVLTSAIAWTLASPSVARSAQPASVGVAAAEQTTSSSKRPPADPNQKICQDITVVGSRLATKRICATRAEWEQKRRDDKDTVDQIQRSPCVMDESGHCGAH